MCIYIKCVYVHVHVHVVRVHVHVQMAPTTVQRNTAEPIQTALLTYANSCCSERTAHLREGESERERDLISMLSYEIRTRQTIAYRWD